MPLRERWTFVSWAKNTVGTQSCPTPPGRSARRSDPTRLWYVRVLDSTGGKRLVTRSAIVEENKENNIHELSGLLDFSAEDFLVTYRSVVSNGSVELRIFFFNWFYSIVNNV